MLFACTICSDILNSNSQVSSTYCGHMFHKKCIEKWLREKNECPQCRAFCEMTKIHPMFLSESPDESLISDLLLLAAKTGNDSVYERIVAKEEDKNPKDFEGNYLNYYFQLHICLSFFVAHL